MFVALNGVVNETLVVAEGVPTAVILEPPSVQLHEADLFNERAFPLRKEDLEELEAVDDFNEMLAEMDVMDAEHESVRRHALSNLQVLKEARNATRIRSMSAASEESSDGWLQKHNDFEHLLGGRSTTGRRRPCSAQRCTAGRRRRSSRTARGAEAAT